MPPPTKQEVVMRFESQEETTKHLEDLKESGEKQVNRLKEDKSKLQKEFEEMKYSGEARLSRYVFETLDFAGFELLSWRGTVMLLWLGHL